MGRLFNRSGSRLATAVLIAATCLTVPPQSAAGASGQFGPSNPAWTAFYSHPTKQSTWAAFCAGGGAHDLYNVLDVTPACGPAGRTQIFVPTTHAAVGAPHGAPGPTGFQSIELVERYLYAKRGWVAFSGAGIRASTVVDSYGRAHHLSPVRNGTQAQLPVAGDVISSWATVGQTDQGEAAVVTKVAMTDSIHGDGTLTWIAQGDSHQTAAVRQLPIVRWTIQTGQSGNHADWLDLRPSPVTITNFTGANISGPYGIAAGPDGALWFTNYNGGSIGRITTRGVVTTFSSTEISYPGDLIVGPGGALWFTSSSNGSVGRITIAGVITMFHEAGLAGPWGIAVGPDHNLWIANNYNNTIARMTTAGKVTDYRSRHISQPWEITIGPDHALWFTDFIGNSIGRITTAGVVTTYTSRSISGPNDITIGPDGALWFTNLKNNSIGRITTSGSITNFRAPTISGPVSITRGPDGAMWFTNERGNSIGRISTAGVIANFTAPTVAGPYDITTGPDGALWFTNSDNSIGRITTPN